jgi:hypothetical protein
MNSAFTPRDIENNADLPWDWEYISMNPNVYIGFIQRNIDKPWNWEYLTCNINITIQAMRLHSYLPWVISEMIHNPNIRESDIEWLLETHPEYVKIQYCIEHPNISPEFIYSKYSAGLMPKYWLNHIGDNPNITAEFLLKHADELDWKIVANVLHMNKFDQHVLYRHNKLRESKLQPFIKVLAEHYSETYWNPAYPRCQKRLMRECNAFNAEVTERQFSGFSMKE